MPGTQYGEEIQTYINDELRRRDIAAQATIVEGQNTMDFGVHIRGATTAMHFNPENAFTSGLSASARQKIAAFLDSLPTRSAA
jgi:hypothetical protein